jgi:hypothetical protein
MNEFTRIINAIGQEIPGILCYYKGRSVREYCLRTHMGNVGLGQRGAAFDRLVWVSL